MLQMMKRLPLLLMGTALFSLAGTIATQAQQPGGLQPKFSADIKRDVAAFVKSAGDVSSQNTLQTNFTDLIKRTGHNDTRILAQIVSEAINEATQTPGNTISKVGHVIQIATLSTVSAALASETTGGGDAIKTIANTVTFQFVSLSAKSGTEPGKNLNLVAQAIAFGVGLAVLDNDSANASTHLTGLAKGALEGSIRASGINNFDATVTTSFACNGLINGTIQVASIKKAESITNLCQAISKGAYSGTIGLTAKDSKPDQVGHNAQAAVRGLLEGVFSSKGPANLDSEALATLAGSTYKGVKETLGEDLPTGIDATSLKEAAFDTWSTKMYTLLPGANKLLQEKIVASLFENSEGTAPLQVAITQGVIKVLMGDDKAKRASELLPLMAHGAVASVFKVEQIGYDNLSPFYTTGVNLIVGGQSALSESLIKDAYAALLNGSLNATRQQKKDLTQNMRLISEILALCAVKSSQDLSMDKAAFIRNAASGLLESAVSNSLSKEVELKEPAALIEGAVEGLSVGLVLGLVTNKVPLGGAGDIVKSATQSAAGTTVRMGKTLQLDSGRIIDFALMSSRGSTSGIVRLIEDKRTGATVKSSGAKLLEAASYGAAMGIISNLIPPGGNDDVNQQELVEFAEATAFGATRGSVLHGSNENAPEYAKSAANGSVLGLTSVATHLFGKPENLETLKAITFAACKGAAKGAISAGADTKKDLKAIARATSYGGTSAATLAGISASQTPDVLSELSRMAARGMAQGTMEAAFSTLVGGKKPEAKTSNSAGGS